MQQFIPLAQYATVQTEGSRTVERNIDCYSSGHISHKQAIEKAHAEYDKYKNRLDDTLSPVEKDFIESIGMLEQITDSSKKQRL